MSASSIKKPTIFAPSKGHRTFFLAQILQPYYGSHPQHFFPELDTFPSVVLNNECLKRLYELTIDNFNLHNYPDAIFFCDKLLTLSNNHTAVIYLMGQCYYRNGDYKRVHSLFQNYKMLGHNVSFQLLAARALLMNKQYEQCLNVLEIQVENMQFNKKMESVRAFIKAQCYQALENKSMAVECFKECLQKDSTSFQAFNRLIDCQLIAGSDKDKLINSLEFAPEDQWLRMIYTAKIKSIEPDRLHPVMLDEEPRKQTIFQSLTQKDNIDILCIKAKTHYQNYQIPAAHELCLKAIRKDPLCFEILPIYVTCLLDLGLTGDLYYCAHNLVQNYSTHPVSWFSVGTYYFHCKKYEIARKYFQKAIMLDRNFLYAWVGMAHSFAVQDESDQAMSIYRTIVRLFPGCAQAHLYMGMEYLRTNNLKTANLSLKKAQEINPNDPLIYSELGVICYKQKNYKEAVHYQREAISLCKPEASYWVTETILTNLAHAYRKLHNYKSSIQELEKCICLNSTNPQTYFSLGFVYHLSQNVSNAISYYHKSLKYKHDNQFAQEMLSRALSDASEMPWESIYSQPLDKGEGR